MSLEVNGKTYETDEEGYLANLNDWNKDLADAMAVADGATLEDNHWEVINFLREYYEEYQIAPAVRVLTKQIGKKLSKPIYFFSRWAPYETPPRCLFPNLI